MQWDWSRSWLQSTFSAESLDHYDAAAFISMGTMFRALSLAFGSLIAYSEQAVVRRSRSVVFASLIAFVAAQVAIIARTQWGDWYPPVRLAGFTVVSGSLVLAAIAASARVSGAATRAREMGGALRLAIAAVACVGAEIVGLQGLRWLMLEKELPSRSLGILTLIVAVGLFSSGAITLARGGMNLARRLSGWLESRQAAAAVTLAAAVGLSALLALHYDSLIVRLPPGLLGVRSRLSAAGAVTITGAALLAVAAISGRSVITLQRLRQTAIAPAIAVLAALGVMVAVAGGSPPEAASAARVSIPSFQLAFTMVAWSVILTVTSGLAAPIGRISYGLYLYHPPIFLLFGLHLIDADSPLRPLWMLAAVLSALAVAALSYRIIERPILRFAARYREGDPHPPAPVTEGADAGASLHSRP
jgi:peptidoglycan/LPS O-acetylase OafA/YrhL